MIQNRSSPAKINLFLHITGRRADGFHELFSLMTKIRLADDMAFTFQGRDIQVTCDHPGVPEGKTNLAHKAAAVFFSSCENLAEPIPMAGVLIHIRKHIPVGGGLGGGSSNAATVLKVLNERYGFPFSLEALLKMGLEIGADVPFFLFGGPALATGVGEKLIRAPDLDLTYLVLCNPGISVPTARVFQEHDFCLTTPEKYTIKSVSDALLQGEGIDIRQYLHNDLEGSTFRLYPEIRSTKEEMERLLQRPVTMSGSGSTLFVLFSGWKNAKQGYECLCRRWPDKDKHFFLTMLQNG
ncbi:MAG: 4-(cytidine 5'-diphospho)-2-C-methyl-D-erythritol kinase [Desulfotignum sp.]